MKIYEAAVMSASNVNGPSLNSSGIVTWAAKNLLPLLLLVAGIGIIASARKGRISENGNHVANIILGLFVIGSAAGLYAFAGQLSTLVFGAG